MNKSFFSSVKLKITSVVFGALFSISSSQSIETNNDLASELFKFNVEDYNDVEIIDLR